MAASQLDPLLLPLLDRIQSQLDRVEGDIDKIGDRFDAITKVHTDLAGRIGALESWRVTATYAATQSRESKQWAIGLIVAAAAVVVSVATFWVR